MKKTASALVLAGSLAFFGAGAANAVDRYPAPEPAGVSDATVTPGATVAFSGSGFTPGEAISVTVDYSNAPVVVPGTGVNGLIILAEVVNTFTTSADASGNFTTNVTLGEAGTYTLTATGLESGRVSTAVVSVDPAFAGDGSGSDDGSGDGSSNGGSEAGDDNLANTGADSAMLLWGAAGVLALGAGVASVAVARRKNA
ncbi:LPXTG cell wall anchor domain-containing protein [Arthrobacter sp. zg-Y820]|uniref:LPXTG cell wall anchor domain-containing protein n=1 Tax=unclassified Arthrobacter TaxID=235627 RepID=UPI001E5E9C61|nr:MULTISPECIES: LPXTG cell wall anchor domain-containing protein [unclassified Arthrobacter]MCC9198009.1 LPXTG cell wall anchor domain-containing protein [Arthrobacter sp. zg-Y820]MDK1280876.1 LPXTG cell wall anchor domain-containing protein [Arthrobacter sp. zg.Y820]WIB10355.1 LPXTG cell wall anchor domain-containing protein [Arthrobacter sp. zg-Y820]